MEKVAVNVGKSLSLPQDVEVLDNDTMKKVAVKVGKHLSELAQQLQSEVKKDVADSLFDTFASDPALWMLDKWKQAFNRLNPVETLWKASLAIGLDLSQELGPLQQNPNCPCGNNDSLWFRRYFDHCQIDQSLLIGICCVPCGQEWLKDKYLYLPDIENTRPTVELHGVVLKKQLEGPREKSPIFQGIGLLPENGPSDVIKVGDHIAWKRPYIIWHHAIVSGVNKVIQWNKTTWGCCTKQIVEEEINLANQPGELYRIEYEEEMINANPTELVIARAKSRIGDNGYSVAHDNCETFAFHCKTGVAENSQKEWFYQRVKEVATEAVGLITGTALRVCESIVVRDLAKWELVEQVGNAQRQVGNELMELLKSNETGAYTIIAMAGFACIVNLRESYEQMKIDNLSLEDFAKTATLRVSAALVGAGLAEYMSETVAGVADAWTFKLPGLEMAIGGFIGWFVGDSVSSIAVQSAGSFIGPPIGRALARAIGTDDRDVRIVDLNPGDQIVVYGKLLHPRHHAIVVSCDQESKKVKVIHSTYEKGVVEEQVDFRDPVYRVIYNEQDCFPPEKVIARARSQIVRGVNEYSLVLNNCKHFAEWCKLIQFNQ